MPGLSEVNFKPTEPAWSLGTSRYLRHSETLASTCFDHDDDKVSDTYNMADKRMSLLAGHRGNRGDVLNKVCTDVRCRCTVFELNIVKGKTVKFIFKCEAFLHNLCSYIDHHFSPSGVFKIASIDYMKVTS